MVQYHDACTHIKTLVKISVKEVINLSRQSLNLEQLFPHAVKFVPFSVSMLFLLISQEQEDPCHEEHCNASVYTFTMPRHNFKL